VAGVLTPEVADPVGVEVVEDRAVDVGAGDTRPERLERDLLRGDRVPGTKRDDTVARLPNGTAAGIMLRWRR